MRYSSATMLVAAQAHSVHNIQEVRFFLFHPGHLSVSSDMASRTCTRCILSTATIVVLKCCSILGRPRALLHKSFGIQGKDVHFFGVSTCCERALSGCVAKATGNNMRKSAPGLGHSRSCTGCELADMPKPTHQQPNPRSSSGRFQGSLLDILQPSPRIESPRSNAAPSCKAYPVGTNSVCNKI